MRISGFLLGSLVGAAAVIYFSRGNRGAMLSAGDGSLGKMMDAVSSGKPVNGIMDAAMSVMGGGGNTAQPGGGHNGAGHTAQYSAGSSKVTGGKSAHSGNSRGSAGGLDRVEEIVEQDRHVKSQVNEILADNKERASL